MEQAPETLGPFPLGKPKKKKGGAENLYPYTEIAQKKEPRPKP